MSDSDKNPANMAAVQIDCTTGHQRRRPGDALAEGIARRVAELSKDKPRDAGGRRSAKSSNDKPKRGVGRQLSLRSRIVYGHSDNPGQDRPADRHAEIVNQFFGEFGIHVTGFGFYEKTWCVLLACPDAIDDDLLENLVNAAWQAATHGNQHPLKKAVARVKRRLDGGSPTNVTAGKMVHQDAAQLTEHRTPKVTAALGQSKLKRRLKERHRALGRKLVRTGLC